MRKIATAAGLQDRRRRVAPWDACGSPGKEDQRPWTCGFCSGGGEGGTLGWRTDSHIGQGFVHSTTWPEITSDKVDSGCSLVYSLVRRRFTTDSHHESLTMRHSIGAVLAVAVLVLTTERSTAGTSALEINQTGAFTGTGEGRIQVTVVGAGDDGVLSAVPWLVSIKVNGTALTVGNMGLQYVAGTNNASGYITVPKKDFTFTSGTTYSIEITVKSKSGNKPSSTAQVRFP